MEPLERRYPALQRPGTPEWPYPGLSVPLRPPKRRLVLRGRPHRAWVNVLRWGNWSTGYFGVFYGMWGGQTGIAVCTAIGCGAAMIGLLAVLRIE